MATFLDVSLIKGFSFIFPFLLVWSVVYAILEHRQVFGSRKELHAIIAFVSAMLVAITQPAVEIISIMTPWFIILLIVLMLMILFFKFLGVKDEDITAVVRNPDNSVITWWFIIVSLIIFAAAVGKVFFGAALPTGEQITGTTEIATTASGFTGAGEEAFLKTLFHPKVLGLIFIFVIASLSIHLLSGVNPKR